MTEREVTISEAEALDAASVIQLMQQASLETDFISNAQDIATATPDQVRCALASIQSSLFDICLLLKVDSELVGLLNVATRDAETEPRDGDLFLVVLEAYQGHGLGQLLMEVALDWAMQTELLNTLTLEVQVRNSRAIHIYKKYGFEIECVKRNEIKSKDGEDLDVYAMRKYLKK